LNQEAHKIANTITKGIKHMVVILFTHRMVSTISF